MNPLSAADRRRLLNWFDRNARDLPWRVDRDPYRIWVSEVMLQQTQVKTVIPYFERFMAAFPTVQSLAAADEQHVLRIWEGLGYYRRARDLHRAAIQVVTEHEGQLTDDSELWNQLPGVGRYILGAVLSQAFNQRVPIIEANTRRLLCRLFGKRGDLRSSEMERWLWETATAILPHKRIGDFNQALMELGALVCTPAEPACAACPLRSACVAYRDGIQAEIPTPKARASYEPVQEVALAILREGSVLLVRRPPQGRWANMWELPRHVVEAGQELDSAVDALVEQLGMVLEIGPELETITHAVTRFRITLTCLEAKHCLGEFQPAYYVDGRWLKPEQLRDYPVSSPQRKLAELLASDLRQRRLF